MKVSDNISGTKQGYSSKKKLKKQVVKDILLLFPRKEEDQEFHEILDYLTPADQEKIWSWLKDQEAIFESLGTWNFRKDSIKELKNWKKLDISNKTLSKRHTEATEKKEPHSNEDVNNNVLSLIKKHKNAEILKKNDIARDEIYPIIKSWPTGKKNSVFKELEGSKRENKKDFKEWLQENKSQKDTQDEDIEDNEAPFPSLSDLVNESNQERIRLSGKLENGEYFYTIPVTKGERTIPLVITSNKEHRQVKHKLKEKCKEREGELSKVDKKSYDYWYFEYDGKEYRYKHKPVFFPQLDIYNNDNSVLKYLNEINPSKDVYRKVRERIKKYWDHPNSEYFDVATAWVIHTYLINNIGYTVYLMLKGREDTGKSTLQKILARTSYNGFFTGKTTPAVSSRLAHFTQSSIQIDEFEKLGEEAKTKIQGVFNTGQRKGGKYQFTNMNKVDIEDQIEALHSFCAKTLSVNNLRGFERSFLSRNIIIETVRTNRNIEKIENIDKKEKAKFQSIRNELMAFCLFNHESLVKAVKKFKEGLEVKGRKSDKLGIICGIVKFFKGEEKAGKVMRRLESSKNLQEDDLTDRNKLLLEVLVNKFKDAEKKSNSELKNNEFMLKTLSNSLNNKLGLPTDSKYKATSRSVSKKLRELGILRDKSQKTRKASGTVVLIPKKVLKESLERYDYRNLISDLFQKVDDVETHTNCVNNKKSASLSSLSSSSSVQDVADSVKKESADTVIDQTVKKLEGLEQEPSEGEFQEIAQEIYDQHNIDKEFSKSQLKEGVQT